MMLIAFVLHGASLSFKHSTYCAPSHWFVFYIKMNFQFLMLFEAIVHFVADIA